MILAGTGHRPEKLGGYVTPNVTFRRVMEGMDKALLTLRPEYVISGMALGVDQWLAELCTWQGIPWLAAIPFVGFENEWPMPSQMKFRALLAKAFQVHVVCPGGYSAWKMQQRNMWMVDHCDHVLAVWDGSSGGTKNCVEYAQQKRKPIWRVPLIEAPVAPVVRAPPPPIVLERATVRLRERAIAVREIPPAPRQPRQESEGMRRARLDAAAEARRQAEREEEEENRRTVRERRVALRAAQALMATLDAPPTPRETGPTSVPEPIIAPVEKQKDDGPTVREFARAVDLDV